MTNAKICLDCHTDNVPEDRRGEKFQLSDGVGCEACHGGSQNWIGVHTVVDDAGGHARNVAAGLFPTGDPKDRARLCLSCHFGDESKFVDHRIMGAGHPRLSFELDTFTQIEPAHFDVDDDYRTRKDVADAVQTWAIGQGMALSQTLGAVLDPKRNHDGIFPEPVLFDCHACHQPMSAADLAAAPEPGPGAGHRPLQRRQPGHAADRGGRRVPAAGQEAGRAGARLPSGEPEGRPAMAVGRACPAGDGAPGHRRVRPARFRRRAHACGRCSTPWSGKGPRASMSTTWWPSRPRWPWARWCRRCATPNVISDAEADRVEAVMDEMYQAVAEDERYRPKVALDALKRVQSAAR